tara:strand:+ start:294 stop:440 length:147 start_codon:yes stop_codon:yes gene_type:complete
MKISDLTQGEIDQVLYCLEQQQSAGDYQDESTQDYKDYSSALEKLSKA